MLILFSHVANSLICCKPKKALSVSSDKQRPHYLFLWLRATKELPAFEQLPFTHRSPDKSPANSNSFPIIAEFHY